MLSEFRNYRPGFHIRLERDFRNIGPDPTGEGTLRKAHLTGQDK